MMKSAHHLGIPNDLAGLVLPNHCYFEGWKHSNAIEERSADLLHHQALPADSPKANRPIISARHKADTGEEGEGSNAVRVSPVSLDALLAAPQLDRLVGRCRENATVIEAEHRPANDGREVGVEPASRKEYTCVHICVCVCVCVCARASD
jgi:hypothetical protein